MFNRLPSGRLIDWIMTHEEIKILAEQITHKAEVYAEGIEGTDNVND